MNRNVIEYLGATSARNHERGVFLERIGRWLPFVVLIAAWLAFSQIGGCAAGRTGNGGTVVGFEVGAPIPETFKEAAVGLGALVGGVPGEVIVSGLLGVTTLAGTFFGLKKHGDAKAAEARHEGETKGWDDAVGKPPQAVVPASTETAKT